MYLDQAWVGTTSMLREPDFTSMNLLSIDTNENFVGCSTSRSRSTCSSFYVALLSTYYSSLESLIVTNVGARGENYIRSLDNVSLSLPTIATCFNASKNSLSMSLPSLKLSLLSKDITIGLDASGSIYIASIALKTSSLTLYNSLSSTSFSSQLCLPFSCFFSQLIQGTHCLILMQQRI
jgi:hypothetical protein